MACKDGTAYPSPWRTSRAVALAQEFETLRATVAAPIRIGSAYRTPTHNAKVGGARNSQHVEGRALDLYPPDGWTLDQFWQLAHAMATDEASAVYGLGLYPTFVHMDVRPRPSHGRLVVWRGARAWAEVKA